MVVPNAQPPEDWAGVLDRMLEGDRVALAKLTRLVASFLHGWDASDFRDEWDDLIQDVLIATGRALSEGRIRERAAVFAYLRRAARNRFNDRLRAHVKLREDDHLPWDEEIDRLELCEDDPSERIALRDALAEALGRLDEATVRVLRAIHVDGLSHAEASRALGLPQGTLKDHLKRGVRRLRVELERAGVQR